MFLEYIASKGHENLARHPDAVQYLASRNVTAEDVRRFRLGYTGVVLVPDDGSEERKRFLAETHKGRDFERKIIFPLTDSLGRVVGLAGRSIISKDFKIFATEEAKYQGFFVGLSQALPSAYEKKRIYVVEGAFDLLAFWRAFPNVVASITSGMNEPQHDVLSMYCDSIVLCLDNDEPGQLGTRKALQWKNVMSMSLGYKDPAMCLDILKTEAFKKFVHKKAMEIAPF